MKFKDGRKVRIHEFKVKDDIAIIKSTMFGDLIGEVKERPACKISYLRIAKYKFSPKVKIFCFFSWL